MCSLSYNAVMSLIVICRLYSHAWSCTVQFVYFCSTERQRMSKNIQVFCGFVNPTGPAHKMVAKLLKADHLPSMAYASHVIERRFAEDTWVDHHDRPGVLSQLACLIGCPDSNFC